MIFCMFETLRPNLAAKSEALMPDLKSENIVTITSLGNGSGRMRGLYVRPFFAQSRMLSLCVPMKRCSGLTQGGLSQE